MTPIPAKPVTEQAALLRSVTVMSIVPVRASGETLPARTATSCVLQKAKPPRIPPHRVPAAGPRPVAAD